MLLTQKAFDTVKCWGEAKFCQDYTHLPFKNIDLKTLQLTDVELAEIHRIYKASSDLKYQPLTPEERLKQFRKIFNNKIDERFSWFRWFNPLRFIWFLFERFFSKKKPKDEVSEGGPIRIDNPGGGDCLYYAFSLGLIDIVQKQAQEGSTELFDAWLRLDPTLQHEVLLKVDIKKPNQKFWERLTDQLRHIVYQQKVNELRIAADKKSETVWLSTHVYGDFAAVFYPDKDNQLLNERCNIFYGMNIPVIEPLPNDCSEKERDAFKLKNFLIQLYGKSIEIDKIDSNTTFAADSSIIKAIENSTSKSAWGTERDAFLLNEALGEKVDVNIYSNQAPPHRPSKKLNSIHLNNENNVHWTTLSFLSPPKKYAVDSASTLIIKP